MSRPIKQKIVTALPKVCKFVPCPQLNKNPNFIKMSIEEFETIHLIDYLDYSQEQCAEKMNVSRATVQRIYKNARYKISCSLIEGKGIDFCGGSYLLDEQQKL